MNDLVLVTGGAGFIGANFIQQWLITESGQVVNYDKLTYAANPANGYRNLPGYTFLHGDICDRERLYEVLNRHKPRAIVHFAAETHVDNSISGPADFIQTNVTGTFSLLEETRRYFNALSSTEKAVFRFLHISTDEVYGSLGPNDSRFTEDTLYAPNSPYSASKAAADHLVRAYHHTYGLPTLTTHCSNNYGPYQHAEKLIPLMIKNACQGLPLPVYGNGMNVRDWIYVEDHCRALRMVLAKGRVGETYNIGGNCERNNLEIVHKICNILDESLPTKFFPHANLITYVKDRPGHDYRYAIDTTKIERELGWEPQETFESGLLKTVEWYINHEN